MNAQQREIQLQKAVKLQILFTPKVCQKMLPALSALNLDYFWFVRLLPGECHLSIGIQPPLVELYRQRKTADLYFNNPQILASKQTTVLWDLEEDSILKNDMSNRIGLQNGMCIFRRKKHYIDIFYVASKQKDSNLYALYLNQSKAIFRLISFFTESVVPFLPMKNPDFLLPYMDGTVLELPNLEQSVNHLPMQDFYDATSMKKMTLHADKGECALSLRELQCVHLLSMGKTSKEIAANLELSYRTVEHYIEAIRRKTGCYDKSQLITLYKQNDIALWFEL